MGGLGIGLLGICFGFMVSGGVFTALLALGLVPRFAGKTHTANKILKYESAVIAGCITGGILSIFPIPELVGKFVGETAVFGTFWMILTITVMVIGGFAAGCFVGCVALAIAEMLDSIPIFARRIHFREGLEIATIAVAIGKTLGSFIYFWLRIYETTGG